MRQTILSDPVMVLDTTALHSEPFPEDWEGFFQITMTRAGRENVRLEILRPGTDTWIDKRVEGRAQNFARAGDTFNVYLARAFNYRVETAQAGAEIWIASL